MRLRLALAATVAALAFAPPAAAETRLINFPAEKFEIAPGGVDMRTGRYVYNEIDLAAGPLALIRTMPERVANHANPFGNFSHNWDIFLLETRTDLTGGNLVGNDYRMNVHHSGRSFTFESLNVDQGFTYKSDGPVGRLTYSGDRASGSTVYTYEAGGTVLTFRPIGSADCADQSWGTGRRRCAFVSEMTEPDGTKYWFQYASAGGGTGNRARLSQVTSSRGYALLLEGSGSRVTKACVINLALASVPANGLCPADALATAGYSYEAGGRLAQAISPGGSVSGFTYSSGPDEAGTMGFVKPGQTTPWLTNHIGFVRDEEYALQEITGAQAFADGQAYNYSYADAPITTHRPEPNIAGGRFVDAEGRETLVRYAFPLLPGSGPTTICRDPPCNLDQSDDFLIYTYQQTTGPVEIIDPLGRRTLMDYCDPLRLSAPPPYDGCAVYPLQWFIDPEGMKTVLEYDGLRNISKVTRYPKPGVAGPDGTAPQPIVTSAVYDVANPKSATKPLSITDPRGNTTRWTYSNEYGGGVLTETGPAVNGVTPQKRYTYAWRYARTSNGDPAGPPIAALTRMAYCRTGNPHSSGTGCALGAADEVVTDYDYGPLAGPGTNLPLRGEAVSADGIVLRTCYAYDSLGRKISETSPMGTAGLSACPTTAPTTALPYTSSTRYDLDGRVTGTIAADPDGAGGNGAPAVRNSYDPAGRLVKVEQGTLAAWLPESVAPSAWTGFAVLKTIDTAYDPLDRKIRESVKGSDGVTAAVTEYSYDLSGRPVCTAVRMNPDAWAAPLANKCVPGPAHATHGPDRISRNVYDKAGQLIETWDGVGTPLERREAAWTYNGNRRKTSLTDARGYRAEMRYDPFDRQSHWTFPSKSATGTADPADYEEYRYDANGNRVWLRKRDGSVLTFHYDALDRMTAKIVPGRSDLDPAHTRDVFYAYDLRGLQTRARFDSVDGEGVTNAWDGFGRLLWTNTNQAGASRTLQFLYDADGNRLRLTHADGAEFGYAHDQLGRTILVHDKGVATTLDDYIIRYWYREHGHRHAAVRGAGSIGFTSVYYYDSALRLSTLANDLPFPGADVAIELAYNPAGQIVRYGRDNDSYAWRGSRTVSRDYAVNGQNQYGGTVSDGVPSATFEHDANGNLKSEAAAGDRRAYLYDVENRLVGASGSSSASLDYDPLGRLFQISGAAGTTQFLYDGDALVAEYGGAGNLTRRYVHGPGTDEPVAVYYGSAVGLSNRRYMLPDERGSIAALVNADGSPAVINSYDEYGIPGTANEGRFQYTGQAWIPELGLYHYKARLYSPTLGRFLQMDPVGYDDQINLYAYVGNDPVNNSDPTGTCFENCPSSYTNLDSVDRTRGGDRIASGMVVRGVYEGSGLQDFVNFVKRPSLASGAKALAARIPLGRFAIKAFRAACCFVAGTLVDTEDGLRPIDTIKVGDKVWALDPATGQTALKAVLGVTPRHERPIWTVLIAMSDGTRELFQTTEEHPWWISGLGWTLTKDLRPGMSAITRAGRHATVAAATTPTAVAGTYNISVEDYQTYFVGKNRILVHNCNIPKPPRGPGTVHPSQRDPRRYYSRTDTKAALQRQGGRCAECREPKQLQEVEGHHIKRHSDGGRTDHPNLAAVCKENCHRRIHSKEQ